MNNQPNYDYENTNYHPQGFAPPRLPKEQGYMPNNQQAAYPMQFNQEDIPRKYKPLGAWAYFGYSLLFAVPIIGFIFIIVFACGAGENINLRNFARSYLCSLLVAFIVAVISSVILLVLSSITGFAFADLINSL